MISLEQSPFGGPDMFRMEADRLSPEEAATITRVRNFGDRVVLPIINEHWETARFPAQILPELAQLGIVGGTIPAPEGPGLSRLAAGLVTRELSRADGSVNAFFGVHSGLAMGTVHLLGSEEQRQRWLPDMAALRRLGAFALTEPAHGSDSVALETSAQRTPDGWVLNGQKRWIGNGDAADLMIVWARDVADSAVKAFMVERPASGEQVPGVFAEVIMGKAGKRAILQSEVTFTAVTVPEENRLPGATSFRAVNRVLTQSRGGIAWEALGHAMAVFEAATHYAKTREQFGKRIGEFQLVQAKLAQMLSDITVLQLLCVRMAELQESGDWTVEMASLAKFHASARAREVCSQAKEILGGNGLLLDYHVVRHLTDMEVVHTYEGTESMQALILGRAITGLSAFA